MQKKSKDVVELIKHQKGITLIALVITIIVLIILAGVAINLSIGENGIFSKSIQAREQYKMAEAKEELELAILEIQTEHAENNTELTLDEMLVELQKKLPGIEIEKDGEILKGTYKGYDFTIDGKFKVTIEGYNPSTKSGIYTVSFKGENVTSDGATQINENETYTANLTVESGCVISTITVKMGETELIQGTHFSYSDGTLSIASVSGNLEIVVVTEKILVTEISIDKTSVTTYVGNKQNLTTTISPSNAYDKNLTWSSSDTAVVKVSEGKISSIATGTATITATANDGSGKSVSCSVTVLEPTITYSANGVTDWELLYEDENESLMYIITKDYLPIGKVPSGAGLSTKGTYVAYWSSAPSYQTIDDSVRTKFMFNWSKSTSYNNIKAVSTLLNTSTWAAFANGTSGSTTIENSYAIGSPTSELWVASWNNKYHDSLQITESDLRISYK